MGKTAHVYARRCCREGVCEECGVGKGILNVDVAEALRDAHRS